MRPALQVFCGGSGESLDPTISMTGADSISIIGRSDDLDSPGTGILLNDKSSNWEGTKSADVVMQAKKIAIAGESYGIFAERLTENSGYSKVYLAAEDSVSITADANSKFNTAMHLNNETGSGIEVNINAPKVLIDGTIDTVNSSVAVASDVAVINGNIMQTASSGLKLSGRTAGVKGYALVAGNVDSINVELTNQSVDQTKGTFKVASLTSSNSTLTFSTMEKGGVTIDTLNGDLGLRAASSITEKLGSAEEAVKTIKEKVLVSANSKDALLSDLSGEASDLTSAWTYDAAADTVVKEGGTNLSPTLTALQKTAGANLAQWRYEVNHLSDRLGDVRNQKGAVGSWARVYGSEAKLSDSVSTKLRANSIQVGADVKVGDNWIVGGAFGYTDQDADYSNGESSTDGYTLAVYGSAYFPCGGYVDLIARAGRLSTDIDATTVSKFDASYDNTAFGVSAEIGYRWDVSKIFYLTPQAELSYGYVRGEDFTGSNGIRVDQDNFETLVGRVGFQAGANFAEGAGTVYLTASLNHDFRGEAEASAVRGDSAVQRLYEDLGGTWVSYGVGAQFNMSESWSFYGSLTRANGSDYQENYKYSVGTRFVF